MQSLSPRFRSKKFFLWFLRRNVFPKFIEICMETPCWCTFRSAITYDRKPTETSVTEFCYNSVNLSLKELNNIKKFLVKQKLFRQPNVPKSRFFDQHNSSLGRHVNVTSRSLPQNREPIQSENLYE